MCVRNSLRFGSNGWRIAATCMPEIVGSNGWRIAATCMPEILGSNGWCIAANLNSNEAADMLTDGNDDDVDDE